jgi:hypothetical protein
MRAPRQIPPRATGKHIGHAVEGHLRGLLRRLVGRGEYVERALPFDFPVHPDAVVLTAQRRIRCLGIVAYAQEASGTHKKYYRTRLEYQEILRCWRGNQEKFAESFVPLTVVYGAPGGWKQELLADLRENCPPTLYLPALLGDRQAARIAERAFAVYRSHRDNSNPAARENVEDHFARFAGLGREDRLLLQLLRVIFADSKWAILAHQRMDKLVEHPTSVRVPCRPFQARMRQGLSLASLFRNDEIQTWLAATTRRVDTGRSEHDGFVRRALFLNLVSLEPVKTLVGSHTVAEPRRPFVLNRFQDTEEYTPHRPDFESWSKLGADQVTSLLDMHRRYPLQDPVVFRGGALDQVGGNWQEFCHRWCASVPLLSRLVEKESIPGIANLLVGEVPVTSEAWQPSLGQAHLLPLWAIGVTAAALATGDRGLLTRFTPRRQHPPPHQQALQLAQSLVLTDKVRICELLGVLVPFCQRLLRDPLEHLAEVPQPELLSLEQPCSWASCVYLAAVTNSTHNPLCIPAAQWVKKHFPDLEWHGWPARRSVPLRHFFPRHRGRVEWQFAGTDPAGILAVVAEVKSITANNWGNKSKELYDRVSETRAVFAQHFEAQPIIIGFVDGDFDRDALEELASGRGYDRTYPIEELLLEIPSAVARLS